MLRALRRRGWVLLVTVLVASACALVIGVIRGTTYTAESTAVVAVKSKAAINAVTPDQAVQLATTYAVLIPKDAAFLQNMATTLVTSVAEVQSSLSVFNSPGTSLLVIDYEGTSAHKAIAGATAALNGITGAHPVTPNITPRSLGAVQVPTTASASKDVTVLVAVGVIVGIALGLLLIVAWERVDPRIDRPEDLSHEIGSPTSPVNEISESGVKALLARWKALAEPGLFSIALVPVTPDVQADLPRVAQSFSQVGENSNGAETPWWDQTPLRLDGSEGLTRPIGNSAPLVIPCEVPSADLNALKTIMDCDIVVLVARKGTPRATLRELLETLMEFGVSPKWAILLDSRSTEAAAVPAAR
jgi:capsular polysaccharide biosynthesis protein